LLASALPGVSWAVPALLQGWNTWARSGVVQDGGNAMMRSTVLLVIALAAGAATAYADDPKPPAADAKPKDEAKDASNASAGVQLGTVSFTIQ
jgi:hypothetical protein